jgi:hypothetical protein
MSGVLSESPGVSRPGGRPPPRRTTTGTGTVTGRATATRATDSWPTRLTSFSHPCF